MVQKRLPGFTGFPERVRRPSSVPTRAFSIRGSEQRLPARHVGAVLPSLLYCPASNVTRGEVAAFLRRHLDLPAAAVDYYIDDGASIFQDDINALTHAGIAFRCGPELYCPNVALFRDEMAELIPRVPYRPTQPGLRRIRSALRRGRSRCP